jgi:hypothetical protein
MKRRGGVAAKPAAKKADGGAEVIATIAAMLEFRPAPPTLAAEPAMRVVWGSARQMRRAAQERGNHA